MAIQNRYYHKNKKNWLKNLNRGNNKHVENNEKQETNNTLEYPVKFNIPIKYNEIVLHKIETTHSWKNCFCVKIYIYIYHHLSYK